MRATIAACSAGRRRQRERRWWCRGSMSARRPGAGLSRKPSGGRGRSPSARLRDGVYVLRRDDALIVKRLANNPASGRVSIHSDNENYPSWPECDPATLDTVGRVIWAGRVIACAVIPAKAGMTSSVPPP